ncbi:unnamed protein product [Didymodactylos carnosus]|uniref:ATP-dependent DNA helicase n=1 Tax=Didymodactylos carnosus TaxID=1234261 RepID=A0A8S2RV11_9BILA|nr:unnamed protein product [Didymodactylos carnosus]CAF4181777.1 unnamed protein product [Didymodactylos carnosus]
MCIPGTSGSGKSHLIQAIITYFKLTNRERALRKLAPTAVAASNIDGQTIHSFLVPVQDVHESVRLGDSKVERDWQDVEYVFIDEMSMVALYLLARLAETITIGKSFPAELPFGGVW